MDQDTNTQNQNAPATPTAPVMPPMNTNKSGVGPIIGIIVILAVLALGGLYFWYDTQTDSTMPAPTEESTQASASGDPTLDALTTTSSQDTASAIEADLSATNAGDASSDLQVQ